MANKVYDAMAELQILNYVFQKNSMSVFTKNDLDETLFNTYKDHYKFLVDFENKYNQLPSKETFQAKFGDTFDWVVVTDPEEFIVKNLRQAKRYRDLISNFKEIANMSSSRDDDAVMALLNKACEEFQKGSAQKCVELISDASKRLDIYEDKVNNPDRAFLTTGLKELDDVIGGWDRTNELAIICARTGFGKSWMATLFATSAVNSGLRVGYYSGEMDADYIGYRFDTFNANLPNGSLTHGNASVLEQYRNYIETLPKNTKGKFFVLQPDDCDGSVTVTKLKNFIENNNLDILFVDQFSLLEDERHGKTTREQFVNLSKDLQSLQRLKRIPFVAAVQMNREDTTESGGPTTKNIAESDRIGQDATTVLFLDRKGDNLDITVGKARNSKTGDKLTYTWNVNMGIMTYIPTENDARNGEGAESALLSYDGDSNKSDSVF